ncbi:MAG: signal peptide peptidase SppA [Chloroflexi bacterium]|nr:signal peptide peptidase SppA [Chloroflexota bacterium]
MALSSNIVADYIVRVAQDLREYEDVRALVLHINSPGGSVVASDRIYHALENMDRPIVVYMDEIAASGGYYISMAGDYIVANPNTLTGSIGVIAVFYNAEGLMEKIGVEPEVIKAGQAKDMGSIYRALTPAERAYLEDLLRQVHENFIRVVAVNRELPTEEVRALADGRIYLASDARDKGLIDQLGYLEDAIQEAGHRANLEPPYRVVRIRIRTSVLDELLSLSGPSMPMWQRWALEPANWPWQQHPSPVLLYLWMP